MRQITRNIFSAVKDYYPLYNASFFNLIPLKKCACRVLLLAVCCAAGFFANAQEVVEASFSNFDYQGCVPVKIQFTDNSTGGPTTWFWDFGDGQTSTKANPSVTYTTPGIYTVKLVVKNAVSTDSIFNQIEISGAVADFNYTYTDVCTAPATINFAAINPSNKIIYRWDFGDANKAIIPKPSNTYQTAGTYKVKLTTISPEGCADSIVKTIKIGSNTVDFDAPAIACVDEPVTFTNVSSPQPKSATWLVNNIVGQRDSNVVTHQFDKPGIYTIKLVADFGTCNNSVTKQIQVFSKPVASFSLNGKAVSCAYPDTIRFNNTSAQAVAFKWYFGDGDSSAEVNPVHVYGAGRFSPVLVAYNANGCTDTLVKTDAVFLGGAIISSVNLPDSGCVPYPITFFTNITAPEAIAAYSWDFGDGSTDVVAQPTHTYFISGIYNVKLTVTTVSGCNTTLLTKNAVSVGTHSIPDFTADKNTVCGSDLIQFNGTASGPVSSWFWKFTNKSRDVAFTQNPRFSYTDTGRATVKLRVSNSGCVDSVIKKDFIIISPPTALFKKQYFCDDRSKVQLTDNSVAPGTWQWDFGDGTTSNLQNPPIHNYTADGSYLVKLTTTSGACTDTYKDTIYINTKKPVFSIFPPGGQVCRKADLELGVDNPYYILDYLWSMGDGHTLFSDTSIHYSYSKTGVYNPSLIARYRNGCQDTLYNPDSIVVTGPTADFVTALPAVCLHDSTFFVDKSFSDGEHEVISHVWNYGDSTSESKNDAPYSHLYNSSGTFKTTLVIADNNNCFDTADYKVIVKALPVVSAGLDSFVCKGGSVQLQSSGALTYVWDKDPALSCLACANPIATPAQPTTFVVTGTDASSCRASDSIAVDVIYPLTLTVDDAPRDVCATGSVELNASGVDLYTWSPADGLSNANISNPVAFPATTTTYTVTGTDSKKCFSQTGSVLVNVHPNPDVTIVNSELMVEKGSSNLISTTGSSNILSWSWYPSEGLSCNDCPQPVLIANKPATYTAVVYADFGCTDTARLNVHILCNQSKIYIPSAFTPNGDGKNERFYVISSTDNPIRNFQIFGRTGELIFSKSGNVTNYSAEGWDGTYRGRPVPAGTYIYRIEVVCNNIVVPFTGTVTLLR